jgi:hypothetical protein
MRLHQNTKSNTLRRGEKSGEPCRTRTYEKFTTGQSLGPTCPSPVSESSSYPRRNLSRSASETIMVIGSIGDSAKPW